MADALDMGKEMKDTEIEITIRTKDGSKSMVFDGYSLEAENGIKDVSTWDNMGQVAVEPNGQRRMMLKLWKGCASYESFHTAPSF